MMRNVADDYHRTQHYRSHWLLGNEQAWLWRSGLCQTGKKEPRDFPDGPVVKTRRSNAGGLGSIPGEGNRSHMPQLRPGAAK